MKQAQLINKKNININDTFNTYKVSDNEVLINIKAVTICGSDSKYFLIDELPYNLDYPLILGHEAAGVVESTGSKVKILKPGDKVAIEPGYWCGHCDYCKSNQYNFCRNIKFMASKGYPGALTEKVVWNEKCLWKLPENVDFVFGALLEPLSVAYAALEKINLNKGNKVGILGAGSIGMLTAKLINILQPDIDIVLVDQFTEKISLGDRIGLNNACFIITERKKNPSLPELDLVIDTTGNTNLVNHALEKLNKGGQLLLIGVSEKELGLSFKDIVYKGIRIVGSYRYQNTYPKLINLLKDRSKEIQKIITHKYSFDESQKAFEEAAFNKNCLKSLISFP